jgi:hypothetical protein
MTDGSASVGAALRAGYADLGASINACWAALLAAIVLTVLATGLPPLAKGAVLIIAAVIAQGALYRRAFGRAQGLKGLRWGRDEWRLLGAHAMVLGLMLLIGSILLVVVGAIALGVARVSAPNLDVGSALAWRRALATAGPAGVIAGLAPVASLAVLLWLNLRLALVAPATVEQSGVRVLSAFPLTKGRVLTLLAAELALAIPPLIVRIVCGVTFAGADIVLAAIAAGLAYLYLAPASAGALTHIYRQSAVIQDA